ncbi:GTP cyclohydrolase III [Halobaculum sp. MBLA0147]|uniref:GTP cyclohydrolase III n=1 Tax=Halobaculum sp. MBLA0147 TaxID=3079934 RepID=UPI00352546C3
MTKTQLTHVQIDNYGPWTVTPEPRREMDLQTLQSRLYADVAQFVGSRDGYAFYARGDNLVAVTNGLDREAHELLQETVSNRYPVSVSVGVGVAERPADALADASELLQTAGSAQSADRTEVLGGTFHDDPAVDDLQVAHFDVDDATGKYTDRLNEFDTFVNIEGGYASLMSHLRAEHGALAFFVGGDNVIAVCPDLSEEDYHGAIRHVRDEADVQLKVGVGVGPTAHDAGMDAKHALEDCRYEGTAVEVVD